MAVAGLGMLSVLYTLLAQFCRNRPLTNTPRPRLQWPDLMALHARVMADPKVQAYRDSPQCQPAPQM